jgi:membrane fusion protein, multidrug efflux system
MVFVVTKDNKLEPRPVELDGWTKGEWIVTKGLKDGDSVLVDGFIKAHDPGMTVKPVPYVPSAAPGAPPAGGAAGAASSQPKPALTPASAAPAANASAATK